MAFHSYAFLLVFLPLVVLGHWAWLAGHPGRSQRGPLLLASLAFYALASLTTLPQSPATA